MRCNSNLHFFLINFVVNVSESTCPGIYCSQFLASIPGQLTHRSLSLDIMRSISVCISWFVELVPWRVPLRSLTVSTQQPVRLGDFLRVELEN